MAIRDEFDNFINGLRLRFFKPDEFLIQTDQPANEFPPKKTWGNIALTARILDKVRRHFGRPLIITSCYRSPDYNASVGGADLSQHQAFTAADFAVSGVSAPLVAEFVKGRLDTYERMWDGCGCRVSYYER